MKKISKEEALTHTIIDGKTIPCAFPRYGTFIDVEEESKIACSHTRCFHGGGMGMGHCAGGGNPFDKNCSEFKDEEVVLKEWEEYERSLTGENDDDLSR